MATSNEKPLFEINYAKTGEDYDTESTNLVSSLKRIGRTTGVNSIRTRRYTSKKDGKELVKLGLEMARKDGKKMLILLGADAAEAVAEQMLSLAKQVKEERSSK